MAFTPDTAFEDIEEVGHKAFLLYAFYCKSGSMTNNVVTVGLERAAGFLDVVYENACRLNAKLKKAGWIRQKNGKTILVKGYEHLLKTDENNSSTLSKTPETDKNVSFNQEETDENNSFELAQVGKLTKTTVLPTAENSKTDENNSPKLTKTTVAYKEEPALLNQQEIREEEDKKDISPKGAKIKNFTDSEKAERLFSFWQRRMNSKKSVFTKTRKAKAIDVLQKIGYLDCIRAISGCSTSNWHMGRDPNNQTLYNEFERIFKNLEETEKFISRYFMALALKHNGGNKNAIAIRGNQSNGNASETTNQRREREGRARIDFSRNAKQLLREQGII